MGKLHYSPNDGFSGINQLARKSGLQQKQVKEFLEQQDIYSRHLPLRKKFPTRKVIFNGLLSIIFYN